MKWTLDFLLLFQMKLEKKRSSSMDKILNKLRSAQRKAQEMRNAVNASQANQVARTARRISYFRRSGQIGSLSGCFTCHAFQYCVHSLVGHLPLHQVPSKFISCYFSLNVCHGSIGHWEGQHKPINEFIPAILITERAVIHINNIFSH